jgi:hypothetical protein
MSKGTEAPSRADVDRLMKRCQIGVGGRGALDDAHDIMAECYGTLGALMLEVERLRADLKAMEGFADLWYFVSDEAPLDFERIVCEYTPGRWLTEAWKLRAAARE